MVIGREMKRRREETRDWSDIPVDLLIQILGKLLFIDHLSFHGVCKAWRSASLQSPPQNLPTAQPHWLMFSKKSRTSPTTWEFVDSSTRRLYSVDLPELIGTRCYLSTHGWLLLFHPNPTSIFFFNPFSRARIDLPWLNEFPTSWLNYEKKPAFALSAPPTSPDCTVFAVSYVDPYTFRIATCRRGEVAWTSAHFKRKKRRFYPIKSAVFYAGKLYWVDQPGRIRAFCPQKSTWLRLIRPKEFSNLDLFQCFYSYLMEWDGRVMMCLCFEESGRRHHVVLKNPRGSRAEMMVLEKEDKQYLVEYYGKEATYVPGWLRSDTFSVGAWCVSCDSEDDNGHKLFSWHLWYRPQCSYNCDSEKSVWIQPKWINPSPSIAWTS